MTLPELRSHVLLRSEQTGGHVSVIENVVGATAPGPSLHTHDFDEAFYMLEGELDLPGRGRARHRGARASSRSPRATSPTRSPTAATRPRATCSSARRPGFERSLRAHGRRAGGRRAAGVGAAADPRGHVRSGRRSTGTVHGSRQQSRRGADGHRSRDARSARRPAPRRARDCRSCCASGGASAASGSAGRRRTSRCCASCASSAAAGSTTSEFEDAIAACNLLPGPASTQLAIFCAWRVRGVAGALVGGLGVHRPRAGRDPRARRAVPRRARRPTGCAAPAPGAGAAVAAVAVQAGAGLVPASWRRARRARWRWVALRRSPGATAAATVGPWLVLVLLGCGAVELALRRTRPRAPRSAGVHAWPLLAAAAAATGGLLALAWVAFKVGALSYGGGFVIIPLMQHDAVDHYHWMTDAQFLNAVALGQVTPGPGRAHRRGRRLRRRRRRRRAARRARSRSRRRSRSSSSAPTASTACAHNASVARVPRRRRPGRDRRDPRLGDPARARAHRDRGSSPSSPPRPSCSCSCCAAASS